MNDREPSIAGDIERYLRTGETTRTAALAVRTTRAGDKVRPSASMNSTN